MGGRPSFPSRQLRRQFLTFVSEKRKPLTLLALLALAVIAVETVLLLVGRPHTMLLGYVLGATHVLVIGLYCYVVRMLFLAHDATAIHQLRGTYGENNTREELTMAKRTGLIWGWVDSVTVESGDVDHLVVTKQGGLVAIDSKWRFDLKDVEQSALAAKGAARRARLVLQSLDYARRDHSAGHRADETTLRVSPVVALWGASQKKLGEIQTIDETPFVPGLRLREWLGSLGDDPIDEASADQLLLDVKRFTQRTR